MKACRWISIFPVALALLLITGCATPRIDWGARVGTYTYDQAVIDLGPPERAATLSDGSLVAEWLMYRGRPAGYYPYPSTRYYHHTIYEPGFPDRFLRLTFDADGILRDWREVSR